MTTTARTTSTTPDGERLAPGAARRVSMADVAKAAGVSAQTVSRVANGYAGVLEDTRQQVLEAMSQLGYRPNSAARALKSGQFRAIGVVMSSLASVGNMRTLEAIVTAALAEGYAITLLPPLTHEGPTPSSPHAEHVVDAVIVVMEKQRFDVETLLLPHGVPIVVADSDAGDQYAVVGTDRDAGARSAVEHLLGLGHRSVWHVAGPVESFAAGRRAVAWEAALREAGLVAPPLLRGDWTPESGYRAGRHLAAVDGCTAVFAANDQMALGVLRALHDAGRRVPDDVSVVGFDDITEAASFLPPLTTVHQDFAGVGRRCVQRVLGQLRDHHAERGTQLLPTRLVVRSSTAAPPPAG